MCIFVLKPNFTHWSNPNFEDIAENNEYPNYEAIVTIESTSVVDSIVKQNLRNYLAIPWKESQRRVIKALIHWWIRTTNQYTRVKYPFCSPFKSKFYYTTSSYLKYKHNSALRFRANHFLPMSLHRIYQRNCFRLFPQYCSIFQDGGRSSGIVLNNRHKLSG